MSRFDGGPDVLWLPVRYVEVDGAAHPASFDYADHGINGAAAVRVRSMTSDDCLILEGRPEEILSKAREILRVAELVVEQTMREPALRSLYGIVTEDHPKVGAGDPGAS